ncbi:MAG TPA: prolyl oligopeptidase family serine peptidase [Steroidobacteraceae bacterium]|jgi:poly(3-hydroxybutyrate) depolymerase|nr:prolyl oligopeptidase family serine peptidase [Steroidobacteraceae bacterium]
MAMSSIRCGAAALLALVSCSANPIASETLAVAATSTALTGECPGDYHVKAGLNVDFPIDGKMRAFVVVPPARLEKPVPVWVALTGTVESTNDNLHVARSGANALMADAGFMVIGPVRECANQDPDLRAGACNGPGIDGWNWRPWTEGRAGGPAGERWKNDAGPDSRFLIAAVRCVAKAYRLDSRRLFVGGISSGGTMTNRALTFRSDFWAGGLPISGEWYVTQDDGTGLSFDDAREVVHANPAKIFQGRVAPFPLPAKLNPIIVISVWGGENDLWKCSGVLCADYRPSTQAASNYFSSIAGVVEVSCSSSHGHMWPQVNTQAFNLWALTTLSSFPKGSRVADFHLTTPPEGYSCKLGRFTDHYS